MKEIILGIVIGIAITIGILTAGLASAHNSKDGMMNGHMKMMGIGNVSQCRMMNGNGHEMMDGMMNMTTEKMDQDNDGKCDICGVPVKECTEMMKDMNSMHKDGHCQTMNGDEK